MSNNQIIIGTNATLKEALKQLNKAGCKCLIVVKNNKFVGASQISWELLEVFERKKRKK